MFWDWFVSYRHLVSAAHFPTYMFSSIKPLHKSQVNSRLLNDIWKIEPTLLFPVHFPSKAKIVVLENSKAFQ